MNEEAIIMVAKSSGNEQVRVANLETLNAVEKMIAVNARNSGTAKRSVISEESLLNLSSLIH